MAECMPQALWALSSSLSTEKNKNKSLKIPSLYPSSGCGLKASYVFLGTRGFLAFSEAPNPCHVATLPHVGDLHSGLAQMARPFISPSSSSS